MNVCSTNLIMEHYASPSLEVLPLGGVFLLIVGDDVAVLIGLSVEHLLFPLGGRHLRSMLFSPFGSSVLEPHLKRKKKIIGGFQPSRGSQLTWQRKVFAMWFVFAAD